MIKRLYRYAEYHKSIGLSAQLWRSKRDTCSTSFKPPEKEIDFENTKIVFGDRSTIDLFRAYLVLKLSSYQVIVENNAKLIQTGKTILGESLFRALMKATFFGHFVAGEDHEQIRGKIDALDKYGVRPILAHDLEAEDYGNTNSNEIIDYAAFYEWNYNFINKSIETLLSRNKAAFIAIKITSLLQPNVLEKLSHLLNPSINCTQGNQLETSMNYTLKEIIEKQPTLLNSQETSEFYLFMQRLDNIVGNSASGNLSVLIDAEYTFLQPAIHRIALEMMIKYSKKRPVVYNTYQNYLKTALSTLKSHLSEVRHFNACFGGKLVRGAYMNAERARAELQNYEDPINESYEKTNENYNKSILYLMDEMEKLGKESKEIGFLVASHNEDSIRLAVKNLKMKQVNQNLIGFAQLYAMSDHLTYSLGHNGLVAYKWLAFGPLKSCLPYLSRRAAENFSMLAKNQRERDLIRSEIFRRAAIWR